MKKLQTIFFLSLLIMGNGTDSFAQKTMAMPEGGYEFCENAKSTVIPFKLIDNLIVISVELNGTPLNLILDSGMPFDGALLFGSEKVDATKLDFSAKMPVGGADGNPILSDVSPGKTLKIPNLTLTNQTIVVLPRDAARSRQFEDLDGIIGFSLFNHLIVSINYERQYMIISQPGMVDLTKAGQEVPVEVRGNRIFLMAEVKLDNGATVPGEFVVDTGNRSALVLNTGRNNALKLPTRHLPYLACGLNGKVDRKIGRISGFSLGGFQLDNVLAAFNDDASGTPPWEKEGNLGNQILGRFHLTFDIPENKIYLTKNILFSAPFDCNLAGLQVERAADKSLFVYNVIPGSPAAKAGIVTGDKILTVNKTPCSELSQDDFTTRLEKKGKKVAVLLERSGEKLSVNMKLERFI